MANPTLTQYPKAYDPAQPLIFIHVPKTAGASVGRIVEGWFGDGYVPNYYNQRTKSPPARSEIFERHSRDAPVCVYGHFNPMSGFGVQDLYPDAKQFVTILRDPFDRAVSGYYYKRALVLKTGQLHPILERTLAEHLEQAPPTMLWHFPRPMTPENYKDIIDEYFITIGFSETLVPSLHVIAALGREFDSNLLGHRNKGIYEDTTEDMEAVRATYQARHPLEFDVYDYAKKRFSDPHTPTAP